MHMEYGIEINGYKHDPALAAAISFIAESEQYLKKYVRVNTESVSMGHAKS
jgi:hypothetical protein